MGQRLDLHSILETITGNVYFQPPTNVTLQYPCIIYHRDYAKTEFADNAPYRNTKRYMVTIIDRDPDSSLPGEVAKLPMTQFNRFFTADNLNHDVFTLYF